MMLHLFSAHEQYSSHEGGRGHIQAAGGPLGAAMGGVRRGCCRGAAARVFLQSLRCDRSSFCRLGVPSGVGPFKATSLVTIFANFGCALATRPRRLLSARRRLLAAVACVRAPCHRTRPASKICSRAPARILWSTCSPCVRSARSTSSCAKRTARPPARRQKLPQLPHLLLLLLPVR